tara:strand:+ start:167 stop:385 length:219 start_codon:yes stop_codon:yes gene_type:complete
MFKNSTCKICKYIRYFLLSVFLLIILAFIQHDKLHYLKFVTPENAATLIIVAGIIIFVGKIIHYYIDKRKKN